MRVVELFAGVGGFRIGLEGPPRSNSDSAYRVVWANQWEPSTKVQHAATIYAERWGLEPGDDVPPVFARGEEDVLVNEDIAAVDASEIPDHEMLCGGFPCQDYSVAKTLPTSKGIAGKKGVLWWEIRRIVEEKRPGILLLENVDRMLKSPSGQRGRDFAVMLCSLADLGYVVEWRVVDASSFGFPQRRKRVFILAYGQDTSLQKLMRESPPHKWLDENGILASALPVEEIYTLGIPPFRLREDEARDLADVTESFNSGSGAAPTPFMNSGIMVDGDVWTAKVTPSYDGDSSTLGDVLFLPRDVPDEFVLDAEALSREKGWIYLKGSKKEERKAPSGFTYRYAEGPVTFPDALDRPSRTVVTGEGGASPSRFKHVVAFNPTKGQWERLGLGSEEADGVREALGLGPREWVRRLVPVELERLNGFPDGHTEGVGDGKRAFLMGNALVCGVVRRIGEKILEVD